MKKIAVSTFIIATTIIACKTTEKNIVKAPEKPAAPKIDCTTKTLTFSADIKPVFDLYCTRCHNENEKAGYNFMTIEAVKKAATNGSLLGTIKRLPGYPSMPAYADKLPDDLIANIECWINNGMKE